MPTGKTTFPLTTTSLASSAGHRVPGASIEEMPCSVRTTSGVPAGIVIPNDASTVRKARLAIPIQIKVCLFIYPNVRDDVRLVYWTLVVQKSERQISLTLPSTPPCQYQDRSNLRLPEPEGRPVWPASNLRREVEYEILPYCQSEGIGVIVYSPMASGVLTGPMTRERAAGLPASDWRSRDVEFQEPKGWQLST